MRVGHGCQLIFRVQLVASPPKDSSSSVILSEILKSSFCGSIFSILFINRQVYIID